MIPIMVPANWNKFHEVWNWTRNVCRSYIVSDVHDGTQLPGVDEAATPASQAQQGEGGGRVGAGKGGSWLGGNINQIGALSLVGIVEIVHSLVESFIELKYFHTDAMTALCH